MQIEETRPELQLLTSKQAAQQLGTSEAHLQTMRRDGLAVLRGVLVML
jgi:hypothetical protein